jgi:hypothetical protein
MNQPIEIKQEYKSTCVAFGASGLPLGQRSQDDLADLAEMAQYNKDLERFFVTVPDRQYLDEYKKNKVMQATQPVITPEAEQVQESPKTDETTPDESTINPTAHEG